MEGGSRSRLTNEGKCGACSLSELGGVGRATKTMNSVIRGGGGVGESGRGQLFLINCFHVIDWLTDWLLIRWLTGEGASMRH